MDVKEVLHKDIKQKLVQEFTGRLGQIENFHFRHRRTSVQLIINYWDT